MNSQKARTIIDLYKQNFPIISNAEIYKWLAVKRFQDNWNIEASEFSSMIESSLSLAYNLLDSGNYFPRRMILLYAARRPEIVRQLFRDLFDEEQDWIERIGKFANGVNLVNQELFPERAHYQDARAILVYLALRYPDSYYFYKFTIFKGFVSKVDYPYMPKTGRLENLTEYFDLCDLLKAEIEKDSELLEMHERRLGREHYFDRAFNILTQDVIYASEIHFPTFEPQVITVPVRNRLKKVDKKITSIARPPKGNGANLNRPRPDYIEQAKVNKRIGDLGELLVLEFECEKLLMMGSKKKPIRVSQTIGDTAGFDILSFDEFGEEIYIEVKTTTGSYNFPFFVTQNELETSIQTGPKYWLFRLYDYDETSNTSKFFARPGSLEDLCVSPHTYRVKLAEE